MSVAVRPVCISSDSDCGVPPMERSVDADELWVSLDR